MIPFISKFSSDSSPRFKKIISCHEDSHSNIKMFNNYASKNLFFSNSYILIIELVEITFIGVIDLLFFYFWLFNFSQQYGKGRKPWQYVRVCTNPKRSGIFTDLVIYTICSIKKDFTLDSTMFMFIKIHTTHLTVVTSMVREIILLNGIFSIFPLAWGIKLIMHSNICHWISKHGFHMTEILVFVLISMHNYFVVMYVSGWMELHLCPCEL